MKVGSIFILIGAALIVPLVIISDIGHDAEAVIWTTENCVMEKWQTWEDIRGVMPSSADEQIFRDECWNEMGASLN